jgi:FAS-associated factor 2
MKAWVHEIGNSCYMQNKLFGTEFGTKISFYRYTLPHPEVINYINSNMLFWACSVTTSEGYRVSQALRENGYPFLAVIVLHDGRMTVVGRYVKMCSVI